MSQAEPIDAWPQFDEESASALCYTSGTTGHPKGVLYSHRATSLYAMMFNGADVFGMRAIDRVLAIVPMFHVNAWGLSFAAGVPTVWLNVLAELKASCGRLVTLERIMSGGAAFPRALIAQYAALGIKIMHAWGMTESSPVVTWQAPKASSLVLDAEASLDRSATQGRTVFGVDVCAQDESEREVPRDGKTQGNLVFRGHWVASGYDGAPSGTGDDGWFPTGDVGVNDPDGYVTLTDRTKDLIKSGGEWISSIAIENIAIAHPHVAERPGCDPDPLDVRAFYEGNVPKWSIPDRVVVAESLPHGATGKILKTKLRETYATTAGA